MDRTNSASAPKGRSFLEERIEEDLAQQKNGGQVVTRFPPEPNGYLHIGHAKSICLNFGLAKQYGGRCHLRFDDTNPAKESEEFTRAIADDVKWLGFDWGEHRYFTSNYFDELYGYALELIAKGLAYVDDSTPDEMRAMRGTLTTPGTPSEGRSRSPEENRELFEKMRAGEFDDGSRVLRAKIDLGAPNFVMRDPTLYRIRRQHHHNTGDAWCIYPMYDFAHGLSDAIEGITHSICTLEFVNNRELYDWLLDNLEIGARKPARPRQYEFNKLQLTYVLLSKRNLRFLVENQHVSGWDDPRMPTLRGLRRRGIPPEAIRKLCAHVGVSKSDAWTDFGVLESMTRDVLADTPRKMAVLDPLEVEIQTYPENESEEFDLDNHPKHPELGRRSVPFSRTLWIEREDFQEVPEKKFFRLAPGKEVRLRGAYLVTCTDVVKDPSGRVVKVICTHDAQSRGGDAPDGRKVKGTLHWVSKAHALDVQVRLYDRLFNVEHPGKNADADDTSDDKAFLNDLNPQSLQVVAAKIEPSADTLAKGERLQFERNGFFIVDEMASDEGLVFNRIVTLRDSWGQKEAPKAKGGGQNPADARAAARAAREEKKRKQREASQKRAAEAAAKGE